MLIISSQYFSIGGEYRCVFVIYYNITNSKNIIDFIINQNNFDVLKVKCQMTTQIILFEL